MAWPYVPAYHHSGGSNLPIDRVVIHCTVGPCEIGAAANVATYFQNPASGGSAHKVADPGGVVITARDDVICWHAPPNSNSLGIELCDLVAGPDDRWFDVKHQSMLRLAAVEVREWCIKYSIPMVKIGPADLRAGKRGICGHKDISDGWGYSDHWDPGPGFPWDHFIDLVAIGDTDMADADTINTLKRIELYAKGAYANSDNMMSWMDESWFVSGITALYKKHLGRAPDKGGLDNWVAAAKRGTSFASIEKAIANSPEARRYKNK